MEKLQLPHAKLLYFVSEMWKNKQIDDLEKTQLKEKVISDEPSVFEQLDNYEVNGSLEQLRDALIYLVRGTPQELENKSDEQPDNYDDLIIPGYHYQKEADVPDELSSPLGNALLNHKKKNQNHANYLKDVLRPIDQNN